MKSKTKYYTVYKTTNLLNGKVYVGCHITTNLNDKYIGSGLLLKRAVKKYGVKNFTKEYIAIFDNQTDMFNLESEIVNVDFLDINLSYNIVPGGNGGWTYINALIPKELRHEWAIKGGKANTIENLQKASNSVPIEFKVKNAKKMGRSFGGRNKLSKEDVEKRVLIIKENVNVNKYGWVCKVARLFGMSHSQVRRFMKKHWKDYFYERQKQNL